MIKAAKDDYDFFQVSYLFLPLNYVIDIDDNL
jgi:hypothetical protein